MLAALPDFPVEKNEKLLDSVFTLLATEEVRHRIASSVVADDFFNVGLHINSNNLDALIPDYLEIFRSPNFLKRIYDDPHWPDLILNLLRTANFTFLKLFEQRVQKYAEKNLFAVLEGSKFHI